MGEALSLEGCGMFFWRALLSSLYPRRLVDNKQEGHSVLGQDAEPVEDACPAQNTQSGARETRRGESRSELRMRYSSGRAAITGIPLHIQYCDR